MSVLRRAPAKRLEKGAAKLGTWLATLAANRYACHVFAILHPKPVIDKKTKHLSDLEISSYVLLWSQQKEK